MDVRGAIAKGERRATAHVVRELIRSLGVGRAFLVIVAVLFGKLRGEPFAALGPARDERELLSRKQAAVLVLLERAVRKVAGRDTALAIARTAIHAGAAPFLDAMLPKDAVIASMAADVAAGFFNAEGEARLEADGTFAFDVHRCHFVELLEKVEASELAPLFCEADAIYFDGVRRPIVLRRKGTLAAGAPVCDFRFSRSGS